MVSLHNVIKKHWESFQSCRMIAQFMRSLYMFMWLKVCINVKGGQGLDTGSF